MGQPSWTSVDKLKKALEEARNAKVIGKSLEAHLTVYPNEVVKTLLEAVNSNVAQLFNRVRLDHRRRTSSRICR